MSTNLLSFLSKVPDPRREAGKRHPLPSLLAMVVLGNLSGYYGYRELARFMERHAWEFVRLFGFEYGVPSYVTIREVLGRLDFEALKQEFQAWLGQLNLNQQGSAQRGSAQQGSAQRGSAQQGSAQQQQVAHSQAHASQAAYSLDGKSLKSTLRDYSKSYQDFLAMVQVYAHQSGLVVGQQAFHNGKQGEAQVVRELIAKLELKGTMLTMDALHCQKKRYMFLSTRAMTTACR
jgi:hypothetical protein